MLGRGTGSNRTQEQKRLLLQDEVSWGTIGEQANLTRTAMSGYSRQEDTERYGSTGVGDMRESSNYRVPRTNHYSREREDVFRDDDSRDDGTDGFEMTVSELLYSTSSFYAIVVPGKSAMILNLHDLSSNHASIRAIHNLTENVAR